VSQFKAVEGNGYRWNIVAEIFALGNRIANQDGVRGEGKESNSVVTQLAGESSEQQHDYAG
jgi:hypothetical protein